MRLGRLLGIVLLLSPSSVLAGPITVTYTFTGSPGNQASEAVDAQPVGAMFSDIVRGPGISPENGVNSINSFGWTSAGTIDVNDYYAFTVTPLPGFAVSLDQVAFTERRSPQGILTFDLRSSLDGFTGVLYTFTTPDNDSNRRHTVPLDSTFDDLTSAVTFSLFGYASQAVLGTWRLGVSNSDAGAGLPANLQVTGDITAVPEPATMLFVGGGVLGLLLTGRRSLRRA
jgi:hypothetical protein